MSQIPEHSFLENSIGNIFQFNTEGGKMFEAVLCAAPSAPAMDDGYSCYIAEFRLPPNITLPQAVYEVIAPDGKKWPLLITPNRRNKDGSLQMSATIHSFRNSDMNI